MTNMMILKNLSDKDNSVLSEGLKLPIMEEFYTIQGEGANTGQPAYFIRVGGCDVGCHWCDVKESWDASIHPLVEVDVVVKNALQHPAMTVIVTGGEPTIYNLSYLTAQLKKKGVKTFIETSGAYPLTGDWDWVCLSPKKTSPPLPEIIQKASELKIIVHNNDDIKWAEKNTENVNKNCKLYLQPEWSKRNEIMPVIVEYVMQHPKWNISLQTHKYMGIP